MHSSHCSVWERTIMENFSIVCEVSVNFNIVLFSFISLCSLCLLYTLHCSIEYRAIVLRVYRSYFICVCTLFFLCANNRQNKDWRNINYKLIELFSFMKRKRKKGREGGGRKKNEKKNSYRFESNRKTLNNEI